MSKRFLSHYLAKVSLRIQSKKMTTCQEFSFGVIADIQYADADDATDFSGKQKRSYRNSLEVVKKAAHVWKKSNIEFVAQLGDIIDGRAKYNTSSDIECTKVLNELNNSGSKYLVNIIGNHELYNFKRIELDSKLKVSKNGSTWYSFKPWKNKQLRMVVLDGYDFSSIEGQDGKKTREASDYLMQHNPNDIHTFGVNWSEGLEGTSKRFMPYNGMIGTDQLDWLQSTLTQSKKDMESVIVLTHIPLHPSAADNLCLLWNYQEVLDILVKSKCVVAVFAGHDHEGGYYFEDGIHHLTLSSPLLCQGEEVAFLTAKVENEELMLKWFGDEKVIPHSLKIKIKSSRQTLL